MAAEPKAALAGAVDDSSARLGPSMVALSVERMVIWGGARGRLLPVLVRLEREKATEVGGGRLVGLGGSSSQRSLFYLKARSRSCGFE